MSKFELRVWNSVDFGPTKGYFHYFTSLMYLVDFYKRCIKLDWEAIDGAQRNTGVKDRSGEWIFEGDIIESGDFVGYVHFDKGSFLCTRIGGQIFDTYLNSSYKIIGNIKENPELLEDK